MIGAEEAHTKTKGSPDIAIAVISSGIDFSIADLQGTEWTNPGEIVNNSLDDDGNGYTDDIIGWDFIDNDSTPSPIPVGHWLGTCIAGEIAAQEGGLGTLNGIAPNVKLMDLRVLNEYGSGVDWSHFTSAVYYATDMGAKVINLSLNVNATPPQEFHDSILYAWNNDVLIVGSTGDNFEDHPDNSVLYPGKYPEVIAVSSVRQYQLPCDWSREGPENEICAPGNDIQSTGLSTWPIPYARGTSTIFATPLVAGTAALMFSVNEHLNVSQVREILVNTVNDLGDIGYDETFGWGLLNASYAVTVALTGSYDDESISEPASEAFNWISAIFGITLIYLVKQRRREL